MRSPRRRPAQALPGGTPGQRAGGVGGRRRVDGVARTPAGVAGGDPTDLRLALGAAAAWTLVALCLSASARSIATVAAMCAAVACLLLRWPRAVPASWRHQLALILFCVTLALVPLAGRVGHASQSPLLAAARNHESVSLRLTVTDDPRPLVATGPGGTSRVAVTAEVDGLDVRGYPVDADGQVLVLAPATGWSAVLPGQRVIVEGTAQPPIERTVLQVALFARSPPTLIGSAPWWQSAAGTVRSGLRSAAAVLPPDERGLLPGLVDGDTAGLDPVLAARFRAAGLTHLVAVSGTNCSIVIGAVVLLLRRVRARPWLIFAAGLLVLVSFVVVARPSPSVLRAAAMAVIGLVGLATGRPRAALPALAVAVLALFVWDPLLATNAGFAMSVAATAALLLLAPSWAKALRRRRVPRGVAEALAVAAAAHVVTAPVVAALSGRVSVVAIPANVLAEPVVAVATMLGFGTALLAPLWPDAAALLAWLAGWPCRWLVGVADYFGGLQGATIAWPGGAGGAVALLVVLLALVAAVLWRPTRPLTLAAALVALAVHLPVRSIASGWPVAGWLFVACDVGQGDALVLNAGPGSAVVVDAGPDPVLVDRCLRDLGVTDVALLVLTHFHIDHVGGLAGVLHGRHVGNIVVGPLNDPATGVDLVARIAAARQLTPVRARIGESADIGAVHLDVLGPAATFHGTRSDPNNSSLVLRATIHSTRILLSADAEVEAQRAMLDAGTDLRADVLKVWHHGSAYFYPGYLDAVAPGIAVISVGLHNDYGHPSPLTLQALARAGVPFARTDQDGDVATVVRDGRPQLVVRGLAASTPAASGARSTGARATSASGTVLSDGSGRIGPCLHAPSPPPTFPTRCLLRSASWETKSTSSTGASARSPPPPEPPTLR